MSFVIQLSQNCPGLGGAWAAPAALPVGLAVRHEPGGAPGLPAELEPRPLLGVPGGAGRAGAGDGAARGCTEWGPHAEWDRPRPCAGERPPTGGAGGRRAPGGAGAQGGAPAAPAAPRRPGRRRASRPASPQRPPPLHGPALELARHPCIFLFFEHDCTQVLSMCLSFCVPKFD